MPFPKKPSTPTAKRPMVTTPKPKSRYVDEDEDEEEDDDYTPPPRKKFKDDNAPAPKKKVGEVKTGWAALKDKAAAAEANNKDYKEFYLKQDESAIVQILDSEPFVFEAHNLKVGNNFLLEVCQLEEHSHCLMCQDGIKRTAKAAFRILDYRGDWDKDAKEYKYNKPIEKVWVMSVTIAMQMQKFAAKKMKEVNRIVMEVSKTGTGTATRWNFETAIDEETDAAMRPKAVKPTIKELSDIIRPKDDDILANINYTASN